MQAPQIGLSCLAKFLPAAKAMNRHLLEVSRVLPSLTPWRLACVCSRRPSASFASQATPVCTTRLFYSGSTAQEYLDVEYW